MIARRIALALALCLTFVVVVAGTRAQNRAGFWDTVHAVVCELNGNEWVGTRCAPSQGGPASNLLPAMSNVATRNGTIFLEVDADENGEPGYLSVRFDQRSISFKTFTAVDITTQFSRMSEPGFGGRNAFVYRTNADDPRFVGVYNAGQVPDYVLVSRASTTPIHGFGIQITPETSCRSFPSCLRIAEQHEQWYNGHQGNSYFPPQANPNWTHEPLPKSCSPFSAEYVPPFLVDAMVFAELRNDLMYLSIANLSALRQHGYDFEALLVQDFGIDWVNNTNLVAANPNARRKPRVTRRAAGPTDPQMISNKGLRAAVKTERYYSDLIKNRLIVQNSAFNSSKCTPKRNALSSDVSKISGKR